MAMYVSTEERPFLLALTAHMRIRMTLAAVWVRSSGTTQELVFASDSRLSGGETWDRGPKVFGLPRSDAAIAFTGRTLFALPAVLHLQSAIAAYPPSQRRSMDLEDAKGHALRVLNEIYADRRDFASDGDLGPESDFILGGWSWRARRFRIWHLTWNASHRRWDCRHVTPRRGSQDVWVWFSGSADAVTDARREFHKMLEDRRNGGQASLDLEPLTIVAEASASGKYRDVGGAPQVIKVYQHMNTQQFAIEWPSNHDDVLRPHVGGRPLLPYEVAHLPLIPASDFLRQV